MTDLSGGIVEKARAMYPETSAVKGGAVSTLVYGVAWDETVRFISKNYPGVAKDSTGYGNYNSSSMINTGSNDRYALYDMAGNVWEWTMEAAENGFREFRGGSYGNAGFLYPISMRSLYASPSKITADIGARIQLYIK